jgi:hypothetical protein
MPAAYRPSARRSTPWPRAWGPLHARPWRLLLSGAAAAAVIFVPTAAAANAQARLESPDAVEVGEARAIADRVISASSSTLLRTHAHWGGRYTTQTGEPVTILVSDEYPQDEAVVQRWVSFVDSLVHGPEISSVTIYLAPPREVRSICGFEAIACYNTRGFFLVAPGEDPAPDTSAEAVLTHEYGHHVAAHRSNPPWEAIDYGTKRWASYEQVCRDTRAGLLFPGAESDPLTYQLNPGEGFAESYRLLNERKLGRPETGWQVVSEDLYPDATSLTLLEQDVVDPWRRGTTAMIAASFSRAGAPMRRREVSTALDGNLQVTVRAAAKLRLRVDLFTAAGTRVAGATVAGGSRSLRATVCGSRSYRVRVTRLSGAGTYRLSVSKP